MLARIRAATAGAVAAPIPRDYRAEGAFQPGDPRLIELFTDRLVDYKATVHIANDGNLTETLAEICREWTVVAPVGVPMDGVERDRPHSNTELDTVGAVVTLCAAACAETGTIVLDAGEGQGRRALSLIPDRHVCVVYADQIVQTVPELLRRLDPTRPLTFISGPSATSDIELNRVEGVHGPRTLIVVIVSR
jgi:L-lactate dehydrogenase complex protein LldG